MVVERNNKTFDVKINALMNVWKNASDEKKILQNDIQHYSIWNYTRSVT